MKQPDLGSDLVIYGTSVTMFFLAGASLLHLGVRAGLTAAAILLLSIFEPYRMARLLAFLNPWSDPKGIGYHIIQSLIAVGSGGIFGMGIGLSRQKFFYIPQPHTDFIFAVVCEEIGLIGAVILITAFLVLVFRFFSIGVQCADRYGYLLACGFAVSICLQVAINMGVVIGLVPTTGIPLPFISYGGTSLVLTLFSVGVVMNIASKNSLRGQKK
jgi:cell division protein FtsW